jgi:hypothetical protein
MPPDRRPEARDANSEKTENRKIANGQTSKIRDRQTPNLLQANLGAFAVQSTPFLFVTISRRHCKARASRFAVFQRTAVKNLLHPSSVPMKRRHLLG